MSDRERHFDGWAETYDSSLGDTSGFPFEGYQQTLQRLLALANPRLGLQVLDLGTGTGALAGPLVAAGSAVTGVDFSQAMLQHAREKMRDAVFMQADLLGDWPHILQSSSFDLVVSAHLFHEFPLDRLPEHLRGIAKELYYAAPSPS